jgi:hypothetical protein
MKGLWSAAVAAFALLLFTGSPAQAAVVTTCPGGAGGTFTVPTDGTIPDGYDNVNCNIVVNESVTPTPGLAVFRIRAASIVIAPAPPQTPPLSIVNVTPTIGDVLLVAANGNIAISDASIKATEKVDIQCSKPGCTITVSVASELISSSTVDVPFGAGFGGPGGTVLVTANGDLSITGTSLWGGSLVKLTSVNGSVTFQCTSGGTGCKDPNIPPIPPIVQSCFDQNNVFIPNCQITIPTAADLKSICIQAPGVSCGGGAKEFDIIAAKEVNIENTALTVLGILVIKSTQGPIKGAGADLSATTMNITVTNGTGVTPPIIDFTNGSLTSTGVLTVIVKGGCPASPAVSIQLTGATIVSPKQTIAACKTGVIVGP